MTPRALLVGSDPGSLRRESAWLQEAGFEVTTSSNFEDARRLLDADPPDVLIADVHLGAFNGIHLALMAKYGHAHVRTIVTSTDPAHALRTEAQRAGADAYLVRPITRSSFQHAVAKPTSGRESPVSVPRRWPRTRLAAWLPGRLHGTETQVLDVSYGGVRIEVKDWPLGRLRTLVQLELVDPPVSVRVRPVWWDQSSSGKLACGAELVEPGASSALGWRTFVDSVTGSAGLA